MADDDLPSAEDLLGPAQPVPPRMPASGNSDDLPSAEDLFSSPQQQQPDNWASRADQSIREFMHAPLTPVPEQIAAKPLSAFPVTHSLMHILGAFGMQARSGFGDEPITPPSQALSPETLSAMKRLGIANDYAKGQASFDREVYEQIARGASSAFLLGARTLQGAISGTLGAAGQALEEAGLERPGEGARSLIGAETDPGLLALSGGLGSAGELEAIANARRLENLRVDVSKWRSAGVTAEGEAGFYDAVPLTPENAQARVDAANEAGVPVPMPRPPPADVHELARRIEPDAFRQFDSLAEQRAAHRDTITKLGAEREASPEATAASNEIKTILGKVHGVEDRLTNVAKERLAAAQTRLEAALRSDTPEMAAARQALLATDYQMRDLAPQVSSAYAQAREMLPETPATVKAEELVEATKPAGEAEAVAPKAPELAPDAGAVQAPGDVPRVSLRVSTGGLRPVEGTGELKTRTLAQGVEDSAIEGKLTESFGDLPEYHELSMADQAAKASELIRADYDNAKAIALGRVQPPRDVLPESVFVALEKHALAAGDVETLRQLATESKLTTAATTMGQRIRTLGERDPASPVGALQEIARSREAAVKRSVADIDQAKAEAVSAIKTSIREAASTRSDWASYIDGITCKE